MFAVGCSQNCSQMAIIDGEGEERIRAMSLKIKGGPAGNRTRMLGLEDPIGAVHHCTAAVGACRRVEFARVLTFVLCRLMSCFAVGVGGRIGGKMTIGRGRHQFTLARP